ITSYEQHVVRMVLEGVRAAETMTRNPETVPPDLTVQALVDDYSMRRRHQAFRVVDDGHPVRIVTLHQVKELPREEWSARTVGSIMAQARDGMTVRPEESMTSVLEKMEASGVRRVLVTRDGRLEGIITATDVAGWLDRARQLGAERPARRP